MNIKGEVRGEYFHIICEKCEGITHNEYFKFKNSKGIPNGVSHLKVTCKNCGTSEEFKIMPTDWSIA